MAIKRTATGGAGGGEAGEHVFPCNAGKRKRDEFEGSNPGDNLGDSSSSEGSSDPSDDDIAGVGLPQPPPPVGPPPGFENVIPGQAGSRTVAQPFQEGALEENGDEPVVNLFESDPEADLWAWDEENEPDGFCTDSEPPRREEYQEVGAEAGQGVEEEKEEEDYDEEEEEEEDYDEEEEEDDDDDSEEPEAAWEASRDERRYWRFMDGDTDRSTSSVSGGDDSDGGDSGTDYGFTEEEADDDSDY